MAEAQGSRKLLGKFLVAVGVAIEGIVLSWLLGDSSGPQMEVVMTWIAVGSGCILFGGMLLKEENIFDS